MQFRTDAGGWYRLPMSQLAGTWSALLPRPTFALEAFEYRIELTSTSAQKATSPAVAVPVTSTCANASEPSVARSIVISVPAGSPVVPPVPAGFSPTGVVAAEEAPTGASRRPLVVAGASALAAVTVAGSVAATSGPEPSEPYLPDFTFNNSSPGPGTVVSLSRDSFSVFVTMSHVPPRPLNFFWRVEMRQSQGGPVCVEMQAVHVGAQEVLDLVFTAPIRTTGSCPGPPLDTAFLRLTIELSAQVIEDSTLGMPYRFEP